ncbi:Endonuclease NucS [Trichinella spiralis]|uniref:Endonuclease NucS n=1 Tax=Trichinella spiralis TaxID=6334 RepID=A0ABR3KF65_TRISP
MEITFDTVEYCSSLLLGRRSGWSQRWPSRLATAHGVARFKAELKRIFQNASNQSSGRGYEPLYGQIAVRWTIVGCCLDGRVTCRRRQLFATAFVGFTSSSVGQALCACCLLAGLLLAVCSTNRENSDGRA